MVLPKVGMMLKEVDVDCDNQACISVEVPMNRDWHGQADELGEDSDKLMGAFKVIKMGHNGRISKEELVFLAICDERCMLEDRQCMIKGVNRNQDEFVCFKDFSRMMELA